MSSGSCVCAANYYTTDGGSTCTACPMLTMSVAGPPSATSCIAVGGMPNLDVGGVGGGIGISIGGIGM